MKRLVIGLVGRKGSGKGTVAKILKEKYGASVYRYSDVFRDLVGILGIEQSRKNFIRMSEIVRNEFGQNAIQLAVLKRIEHDSASLVVLDGLRRLGDLEGLERLDNFVLVNIVAPLEIRYDRLHRRIENTDEFGSSLEEFKRMELASTEVTIGDVETRATKILDNSGNQDELLGRIALMMKGLGYES